VNFVLKFGACKFSKQTKCDIKKLTSLTLIVLPPLGYNQKLMEALYRIPLSFQLCERLNSLLHFFTQHKEPHLQTRVRLDNLAEWEKPIQFQMSHLIEKNDQEFILIQKYLENSSRCRNQNFVIEAIYKIQNEVSVIIFSKHYCNLNERRVTCIYLYIA
jgi:hypothetical protein